MPRLSRVLAGKDLQVILVANFLPGVDVDPGQSLVSLSFSAPMMPLPDVELANVATVQRSHYADTGEHRRSASHLLHQRLYRGMPFGEAAFLLGSVCDVAGSVAQGDELSAVRQRSARRTHGSSLMNSLTFPARDIQPEATGRGKGTPKPKLSGQVLQHGLTGLLGFGERLEG